MESNYISRNLIVVGAVLVMVSMIGLVVNLIKVLNQAPLNSIIGVGIAGFTLAFIGIGFLLAGSILYGRKSN